MALARDPSHLKTLIKWSTLLDAFIFNLVRALILAAMTFAALVVLGTPALTSFVFSFIVLVFGGLHLVTQVVYGFTALVVIAAACSLLVPVSGLTEIYSNAGDLLQGMTGNVQ